MKKMVRFSLVAVLVLTSFIQVHSYHKKPHPPANKAMIYHTNIMNATKANDNFRNVLASAVHSQVVLMSLVPGESIGNERHDVDQMLVFVEGTGKAIINKKEYTITPGDLFLVPAGAQHNFINTGKTAMKLFTVYAPREHKQGLIQKSKPQKAD